MGNCLGKNKHPEDLQGRFSKLQSQADVLKAESSSNVYLQRGILKFNQNPKKGVAYLFANNVVPTNAAGLADFLLFHCVNRPRINEKLSKTKIGEFIGSLGRDESERKFHAELLSSYCDLHFSGVCTDCGPSVFIDSLRSFLSSFRLPGESQVIDRIMFAWSQSFTKHYPSFPDVAYILAFAAIILNTDLHKVGKTTRPIQKMTLQQFVANLRGIDNGRNVDPSLLEAIYRNVEAHPFELAIESDFASFFDPSMEGWVLKKCTGHIPRWKRRYFVLTRGVLYYFLSKEDVSKGVPRCIIPLENVDIECASSKNTIRIFSIEHLPIHTSGSSTVVDSMKSAPGSSSSNHKSDHPHGSLSYVSTDGSAKMRTAKRDANGNIRYALQTEVLLRFQNLNDTDAWLQALRMSARSFIRTSLSSADMSSDRFNSGKLKKDSFRLDDDVGDLLVKKEESEADFLSSKTTEFSTSASMKEPSASTLSTNVINKNNIEISGVTDNNNSMNPTPMSKSHSFTANSNVSSNSLGPVVSEFPSPIVLSQIAPSPALAALAALTKNSISLSSIGATPIIQGNAGMSLKNVSDPAGLSLESEQPIASESFSRQLFDSSAGKAHANSNNFSQQSQALYSSSKGMRSEFSRSGRFVSDSGVSTELLNAGAENEDDGNYDYEFNFVEQGQLSNTENHLQNQPSSPSSHLTHQLEAAMRTPLTPSSRVGHLHSQLSQLDDSSDDGSVITYDSGEESDVDNKAARIQTSGGSSHRKEHMTNKDAKNPSSSSIGNAHNGSWKKKLWNSDSTNTSSPQKQFIRYDTPDSPVMRGTSQSMMQSSGKNASAVVGFDDSDDDEEIDVDAFSVNYVPSGRNDEATNKGHRYSEKYLSRINNNANVLSRKVDNEQNTVLSALGRGLGGLGLQVSEDGHEIDQIQVIHVADDEYRDSTANQNNNNSSYNPSTILTSLKNAAFRSSIAPNHSSVPPSASAKVPLPPSAASNDRKSTAPSNNFSSAIRKFGIAVNSGSNRNISNESGGNSSSNDLGRGVVSHRVVSLPLYHVSLVSDEDEPDSGDIIDLGSLMNNSSGTQLNGSFHDSSTSQLPPSRLPVPVSPTRRGKLLETLVLSSPNKNNDKNLFSALSQPSTTNVASAGTASPTRSAAESTSNEKDVWISPSRSKIQKNSSNTPRSSMKNWVKDTSVSSPGYSKLSSNRFSSS